MSGTVWADACCVCRWPIYTDMTGEHDGYDGLYAVGDSGSEAHPWCAPFREQAHV